MNPFNPQVGDRAHVRYLVDAEPCTIVARTAKTVTVRYDMAEIDPSWRPEQQVGGFAARTVNNYDQKWVIGENPQGRTQRFSLRKSGDWLEVGAQGSGARLGQGWRRFYDYNF